MMLFAELTESVNHANVVPSNIEIQSTRAIMLVVNVFLENFLVIVLSPYI